MIKKTNNEWGREYSSPVCEMIELRMGSTILSGEGSWTDDVTEVDGSMDF